jgi:hypothetical protein
MSSGLPILAWNCGFWTDPLWEKFDKTQPAASSVPYFDATCGETFKDMDDFSRALDRYLSQRSSYDPRGFVANKLNQQTSAKIYADHYFGLISEYK